MTYRIILSVFVFTLIFSSCDLFEEPSTVSFKSNIYSSSTDEFVIYSKPNNGKVLHHERLYDDVSATFREVRSPSLHLTHCHLIEIEGSSFSDYRFVTFVGIPPGDYQRQAIFREIEQSSGFTFYLDVVNVGNNLNPVVGENPFYSVLGQTISYEPSVNGGHLFASVLTTSPSHGYVSFEVNGERRYFYANDLQDNDTVYVDFTTLPVLPNIGQVTLDDTYQNSRMNVVGYFNEGFGDPFVAFSPFTKIESLNQFDLYIPPVNDFDFYWLRTTLHKNGQAYRLYQTETNANAIPRQINFTDWTLDVEDETWRQTKIATSGDFDIIKVSYSFSDSDAGIGISWDFYMPQSAVEVPDIILPDEFYTSYNHMDAIENLKLINVSLYRQSQIDSYADFVEFALISNEGFDGFSFQSLSGK